MVTEKNNMHDIETFMFFKWIFKAFVAVFIVTKEESRMWFAPRLLATEALRRIIHYNRSKAEAEMIAIVRDIMDAEGEVALPVRGGKHLKEDFVGSHYLDYDFTLVLSHFKGQPQTP